MAIARLSMKLGKRGKGGAHADYIMRQGEYALQHEKFEKLEAVEVGNMPTWAVGDPRSFFVASDANERANAKFSYREMELSLPREMTAEQRQKLMNDWCKQELPNYPFLYAIHNPKALDGGDQPHAHLMFSERENDGIERDEEHFFKRANGKHPERGGARKTYNLEATKEDRQNRLTALRQRWQEHVNEHLALAQLDARIDMRSYAAQGVDKEPQPKMTPRQAAEKRRLMAEANTWQAKAATMRANAKAKASEYIQEQEAKARVERVAVAANPSPAAPKESEPAQAPIAEKPPQAPPLRDSETKTSVPKSAPQAPPEPAFDARKMALEIVKMNSPGERHAAMLSAAKMSLEDFDALDIELEQLMDALTGELTEEGLLLRAELVPRAEEKQAREEDHNEPDDWRRKNDELGL